jgi:Zn-dependent protease
MLSHLLLLVLSLMLKAMLIAACLLAHEGGHALAARCAHVPVRKIGLNRMGVYIQRARAKGWAEVSICLAGPAMNFALAAAFWNVNYWFALCNLVFAWVNLLPITNSDGSHALDALSAMYRRANA